MDFVRAVREAIYTKAAQGGPLPSVDDVVEALRVERDETAALQHEVSAAYQQLAAAHVIILKPGTSTLWAAPPFAGVTTRYRVRSGERSYSAPCAWDAFGIPAAIRRDAAFDAQCPQSGAALACGVANGRAYGDGVIHLEVPARRFWDDIFNT